jgi:hypothetical protein
MGLDLVEAVMDLEERFQTELADEAVQRCHTVGELIDLLAGLSHGHSIESHLGRHRVARLVRLTLARQFAVPYRSISESTTWRELGA